MDNPREHPRARAGPGRRRTDIDPLIPRSTLYALFMQAPVVIAVFRGVDHVFDLVNPGYQDLFRGRPLLGRPVRQALPEIEGQGYFEILDRVYATGESHAGREVRVMIDRRGDGVLDEAFFNFIYQPLLSIDGRVEGIIAFGFEVTA